MLSILFSEFKEWGCPNCGCDSVVVSLAEELPLELADIVN